MATNKSGSDGLMWALAGNVAEKIKKETNVDLGMIFNPRGLMEIVNMRDMATKKRKRLEQKIRKVEYLMKRGENLLTLYRIRLHAIDRTFKSLDTVERDFRVSQYSVLTEKLNSDISQLGLASGHQDKKEVTMDEVFGK